MPGRLKIRWKMLIALMLIGVGPLLFSGWLDARRLSALGARLAEQSGEAVSEQTRTNLQHAAQAYARRVERERQLLELALRLQAREARAALSGPVPAAPIYWTEAFDANDPALALQRDIDKYHTRANDAGPVAIPVSFEHQVCFRPAAAGRAALAPDAARLSALTSLYQEIHADHGDVVHRQFVALENGLLSSYPGHGGFPADFDPRSRAWYRQHREAPRLRWAPPHIDAVTGRTFINVTAPLLDPAGALRGVAGIDVSLVDLLHGLTLPAALGRDGEALLTFLLEQEDPARAEIVIVARSGGETAARDWREPVRADRLELNQATAARLHESMREREPAYLRSTYAGRDSVLVYQPFGRQLGDLMFIVPASTLVDPAVRAARYALESTQRQIDRALPLGFAIIAAVALLALLGSRAITAPIKQLADAVNRVADGRFETRVQITSGDELEELGDAFNAMVPQLREHTRVREALNLAAEVQRRLLPPTQPALERIDIAGFSTYSEQTGGDYYDFLPSGPGADPRRLGVALGDVSGHGVASALLMATVRALLRGVSDTEQTPAAVMNHINEKIVEGLAGGQFMTLCYFDIELESGFVRWCSAGHDPAIRFNRTTNTFSELAGADIPLGVDGQWRYGDNAVSDLGADDLIVLATDGIWETRNAHREFFGKPRLRDLIRAHRDDSAAELCQAIKTDLARFRGAAPQRDDVTAVVFRLQPGRAGT